MKINEFKIRKNKQRPELCYGYQKKEGKRKYQITTFNSGKTFLATIEDKRADNRYYQEFSEICISVDNCLTAFVEFEKEE